MKPFANEEQEEDKEYLFSTKTTKVPKRSFDTVRSSSNRLKTTGMRLLSSLNNHQEDI